MTKPDYTQLVAEWYNSTIEDRKSTIERFNLNTPYDEILSPRELEVLVVPRYKAFRGE